MDQQQFDDGTYSTRYTHALLTSDFDPSSLKVVQLRGLLFERDVVFPSNAKKKELVDLFKKHVRNAAPATLKNAKLPPLKIIDASALESRARIPSDVTPTKLDSSGGYSRKSSSKKRHSDHFALEKPQLSPSKGNVFEIDSDSEPELLSQNKIPKRSKNATPLTTVLKTPRTTNVGEQKPDSDRKKHPESPLQTPSSVRRNQTPTTQKHDQIRTPKLEKLKSPKSGKAEPAPSPNPAILEEQTETPTKNAVSASEAVSSASTTPEIEHVVADSESDGLDAARNSWQNSYHTTSVAVLDNAQSFDDSLAELKKEDDHFNKAVNLSREPTDVELARLLGVDIESVKPKARGKRIISPRNPIVIQKSRLSYSEDLSGSDTEDETVKTILESESRDKSGAGRIDSRNSDRSESSESNNTSEVSESENSEISQHSEISRDRDRVNVHHEKSRKRSKRSKAKSSGKKPRSSRPSLLNKFLWSSFYLFSWLLLAGGTLFAYWYREQTFLVGYCGHEINKTTIPRSPDTPGWLVQAGSYLDQNFKPQCVECPQHARCFANLELGCYDDFVEFTPWYFPYMPIVDPTLKKCIPDTKRAEKIEIMIDVALDLLRAKNANRNCGRSEDDLDAGIQIDDLHDLLLAMKAPYITLEEFEDLWLRSVVELEKEPEIIVRQVTHFRDLQNATNIQVRFELNNLGAEGVTNNTAPAKEVPHKVLRSTSLSHISMKCRMSNTLVGLLLRFKLTLGVVVLLAVAGVIARIKYSKYRLYQVKVETLYKEVLSKLQRQARLARESTELPAYIGLIQLRDLILSDETNLARKMRMWEAVSRKVDRNTNVRHQLLEIHGEVMKVWQWILTVEE